MALKGKKKSRDRGSQARRKPAGAPRPSYGAHQKARWYQTTQGLVIAFLVAVTVIVFVWWWVADSREDAQARETRQEQLQAYTADLRTLIQSLAPIATEIAGSSDLSDDELKERTKAWKEQIGEITVISKMIPPQPDLAALTGLVDVIMGGYGQSIEQFELVPTLEGEIREKISAKAAASYLSANNVLVGVIGIVDGARAEADLPASGLTPPGSPEVTTPSTPPGG